MKENLKKDIRILILEDDLYWEPIWQSILDMFSLLEKSIWVNSVKTAEQTLESHWKSGIYFPLIISDVFVAGAGSGLDLLEKYGHQIENSLLFVSSVSEEKLKAHTAAMGYNVAILQKPFKINDGISNVFKILKSNAVVEFESLFLKKGNSNETHEFAITPNI